jgi:hypothetical protein
VQHSALITYQSAFLLARLITDNIIAAYETLHSMHTHMWSKVGFMGITLDMSKASDRVEWAFLEAMMVKMGFTDRWIQLIMKCVRSASYAILVNGKVTLVEIFSHPEDYNKEILFLHIFSLFVQKHLVCY